MTEIAAGWEPIRGFRSPAEFERFERWIGERVADGTAELVPVDPAWRDANPMLERWLRHRPTGEVWRLIEPDPPSAGAFDRLEPGADRLEPRAGE